MRSRPVFAAPLGDLNAIHPFRDGNGRAMRVDIAQLADAHGLAFDQTQLDPAAWNEASRGNFITADPAPMRAVVLSALSILEREQSRDRDRDRDGGGDPTD